jgi:hypothetical protein
MNTTLHAAIAASLLTAAAPAAATAPLSHDPIQLESVISSSERNHAPGQVGIAFKDTADSAAREVTFRIQDPSGRQADIDDVGNFSPGVTIVHNFPVATHDTPQVRVTHVELADGTTWDAPLSPQPRRQAVLEPSLPNIESGY